MPDAPVWGASDAPVWGEPDAPVWGAPDSRYRYAAFVSYSHRDKAITAWFHRALERYRIPRKLVGTQGNWGPVPPRLAPVFRDRDELPAAGDLGAELRAALSAARFLIVIASPASARSRWVNEEILAFKQMHGEKRVIALVVDGEPNAQDPAQEALAPALRFHLAPDGTLSDRPAEPIAADLRPEADGRRLAFLKVAAGIAGVGLDSLARRDAQRRTRQLTLIAALSILGMAFTSGLAFYADTQRREADRQRAIAEQESETARAAAAYMVDTFRLASPATENPRTISAFEILRRSAQRAETELANQPEILVRIMDSLAWSYVNLGLFDEAEEILGRVRPAIDILGPEGVYALRPLAEIHLRQGRPAAARRVAEDALERLGAAADGKSPQVDSSAARLLLTL
ncbi:MAG: toll/interleukin-1 receptor domain-containing protein, partial [Sphingomonadaceae bacterium]